MKEFISKIKVFFFAAVLLTVLCIVLFTVSMFTSFDADVGYFSSNALLPYIQKAVVIVSIVFFASIVVLVPKGKLPAEHPSSVVFTTFASLACGFLCVISTIIFYMYYRNDAAWMMPTVKYIFLAITVTGILSAAYFIITALTPNDGWLTLKTVAAIFVIANLLLIIIFEHLDYFVPINSVRKTMLFVSFASAIMFVAQDIRFKAGIGQPRGYFFFGATAMLLCSTTSVSHIIAHYAGALKDSSFLMYYLIGIGLALYAFAKLLAYVKYAEYISAQQPTEVESSNDNEEV